MGRTAGGSRARRILAKRRAEDVVAIIGRLDRRGTTYEQMAAHLNVSVRSIHRWLHRESVPQPGHYERLGRMLEELPRGAATA